MKGGAALCIFGLLFVIASKSPAQTNWKGDWEKLVKAAREEGRLTVYGTTVFEDVFKFFQKAYPEIKLSFGRRPRRRDRAATHAGKTSREISRRYLHWGHAHPYEVVYANKALNAVLRAR